MATLTDSSIKTIQITSGSPAVTISGSTMSLQLPNVGFHTGSNDEVCLASVQLYYSWKNVTAAFGNNQFSYIFNGVTYPVILPDIIAGFSDIWTYLQSVQYSNGHYLVDSAGTPIYYLSIILNAPLYCNSLIATPLPLVLPAGWSNPNSLVLSGVTPQVIIPQGFSYLSGFAAGTYPVIAQPTLYQVNSGVPQITSQTSINIKCNLAANSGFTQYPGILTSFTVAAGTLPGSMIIREPYRPIWLPIQPQQNYQTIDITFLDQLLRNVILTDTAGIVVTLLVRKKPSCESLARTKGYLNN